MSIKKGLKYFAIFLVSVIALAVLCATVYRYHAQREILSARAIHLPEGINTVEPVRIGGRHVVGPQAVDGNHDEDRPRALRLRSAVQEEHADRNEDTQRDRHSRDPPAAAMIGHYTRGRRPPV